MISGIGPANVDALARMVPRALDGREGRAVVSARGVSRSSSETGELVLFIKGKGSPGNDPEEPTTGRLSVELPGRANRRTDGSSGERKDVTVRSPFICRVAPRTNAGRVAVLWATRGEVTNSYRGNEPEGFDEVAELKEE